MKKKVFLFAAAILTLSLTAGCQKQTAENLPQEEETETASSSDDRSSGLNVKLDENRIILEQSFHAELGDWEDVRFVSYGPAAGSDFEDVSFYLMKNGKVVFTFPYYGENNKTDQALFWQRI